MKREDADQLKNLFNWRDSREERRVRAAPVTALVSHATHSLSEPRDSRRGERALHTTKKSLDPPFSDRRELEGQDGSRNRALQVSSYRCTP